MLRMCVNPRALVVLAVVGLVVHAFAPNAFRAVLPVLVVALCPLSMLVMMAMMRRSDRVDPRTDVPAVTDQENALPGTRTL